MIYFEIKHQLDDLHHLGDIHQLGDLRHLDTVLPLIKSAGIMNFYLFPAGIIRGRELLEVLKIYSLF